MVSKSGHKKKKKFKYTKNEFKDIICKVCLLCPEESEPNFCYDGVYKEDPKRFVNSILKELIKIKDRNLKSGKTSFGYHSDEEIMTAFVKSFCKSGYCPEKPKNPSNCMFLIGCLHGFREQLSNSKVLSTFFCNDNMINELRNILNGFNSKQQDKD